MPNGVLFLFQQGKLYDDCITDDNDGVLWCSTTAVYEGSWINCYETGVVYTEGGTGNGQRCVFPFTYNGVSYNTCIRDDHDRPWCSTTQEYAGYWGNCIGMVKSSPCDTYQSLPEAFAI